MPYNTLGYKKTFEKTEKGLDTKSLMVSNIQMKNPNAIYTLTLDYTREGEPKRMTTWVRQTHREAMKKLRRAQEHGDNVITNIREGAYPLQSWQLSSGWQTK